MNKILKIGATFDWITPLYIFIRDRIEGSAVRFGVSLETGWGAGAIQTLLNEAGIRVWGIIVIDDTVVFTVRRTQARYTRYWLEREGIVYSSGGNGQENSVREKRQPDIAPSTRGWFDKLLDGIDGVVDRL